jgi:hypothetical protein
MLIQCGFNPCDWCIPTQSELSSFGYPTCSIWGAAPFCYWSSNELSASTARDFRMGSGLLGSAPKSSPIGYLRAWRRVTY